MPCVMAPHECPHSVRTMSISYNGFLSHRTSSDRKYLLQKLVGVWNLTFKVVGPQNPIQAVACRASSGSLSANVAVFDKALKNSEVSQPLTRLCIDIDKIELRCHAG